MAAILILSIEGVHMFDGFVDRILSEERSASRILLSHPATSARWETTVKQKIATITALILETITKRFDDSKQATEPSTDSTVVAVIRTVVE